MSRAWSKASHLERMSDPVQCVAIEVQQRAAALYQAFDERRDTELAETLIRVQHILAREYEAARGLYDIWNDSRTPPATRRRARRR